MARCVFVLIGQESVFIQPFDVATTDLFYSGLEISKQDYQCYSLREWRSRVLFPPGLCMLEGTDTFNTKQSADHGDMLK